VAVPKEIQKELIISVEHPNVAISPPVLDSVIVVGHAPTADPRTMLFAGYVDDVLNVRTINGQIFQIGEVVQPTTILMEQVLAGSGNPMNVVDGQFNNRIYMDTYGKGIYIWSDPGDTDWENPQVVVVANLPTSARANQIFIDVPRNSIWMWH